MRGSRALTEARFHQVEDCEPPSEELRATVRRVIAQNAQGDDLEARAADARELMLMLGVHPSQDELEFLSGVPPLPTTPGRGFSSPTRI